MKMNPEGQTLHGDHTYVFYQIPAKAGKLPLVFFARCRSVFKNLGKYSRRT